MGILLENVMHYLKIGLSYVEEIVVHIHNGILLSHKKEHIWVNSNEVDEPKAYLQSKYLLTHLQSGVSQTEKDKYHILMYIYGI